MVATIGSKRTGCGRLTVLASLSIAVTGCSEENSPSRSLANAPVAVQSCALCHGEYGEGIEARSAPPLAGLDAVYLERQLEAFSDGRRGSAAGDWFGPQMVVIAKSIDPAARKQLATYYASQSAPAASNPAKAESPGGREAYEACAACHGADGQGNPAVGAPRLAGQPQWYLVRSLKTYRAKSRGYAADDVQGQQMAGAVQSMGDDTIAEVSAYLASRKRS